MNTSKPQYSILIPTYNRGNLLPLAIQSVLDQTNPDFELIVSNGGSSDNTDEVVRGFVDSRIRYFSSEKRLGMAENYEFALDQAKGEFIVFFSDDDALVPSMLERIETVLNTEDTKMVVFPFARYFADGDAALGVSSNTLEFSKCDGSIHRVTSEQDLRRMASRFGLSCEPERRQKVTPLIGNVVFHRTLLESVQSRVPSVFGTIPVDGYFITLLLCLIEDYVILDLPLLSWSQWAQNASRMNASNLREHYEGLLSGRTLDHVPIKLALPMNCAANAILQASHDLTGSYKLPTDWNCYFLKMHEYLLHLQLEGLDMSHEFAVFERAISEAPAQVHDFLQSHRTGLRFRGRQHLKTLFRSVVPRIRNAQNRFRSGPSIRNSGGRSGFSNVLESARFLDLQLDNLKS